MRLYGFNLTKKSTALHQRLKRVKENGDKDLLIVKRNSQRHYTYWSPYEDELKGSTIVDFIGNEHGLRNIDQICKIVDDIIAGDNQVQAPRLELNKPSINVRDIIKHTKPLSNQTYLKERGFAEKTAETLGGLQSPRIQARKRTHAMMSELDQSDSAATEAEDIASGKSPMLAGMQRFGRDMLNDASRTIQDPSMV